MQRAMNRTQIYLTADEVKALKALAIKTGRNQSALIREAVDEYIRRWRPSHRRELLAAGRGLWKNRKDLPDFAELRREWDRGLT